MRIFHVANVFSNKRTISGNVCRLQTSMRGVVIGKQALEILDEFHILFEYWIKCLSDG